MITVDEILSLYKQRVNFYGPLHSKMKLIQSIYNGTMEVPLLHVGQRNFHGAVVDRLDDSHAPMDRGVIHDSLLIQGENLFDCPHAIPR